MVSRSQYMVSLELIYGFIIIVVMKLSGLHVDLCLDYRAMKESSQSLLNVLGHSLYLIPHFVLCAPC